MGRGKPQWSRMAVTALAITVAAGVSWFVALVYGPGPGGEATQRVNRTDGPPRAEAPAAPATLPATTQRSDHHGEFPLLAPSLAGTTVPDVLHADANGELILTEDISLFFDYFMSAFGEASPEQIEARIRVEIGRRLPPRAAARALRIAEDYVTFRFESDGRRRDLQQAPGWSGMAAQDRLAAWQGARRDFFEPDVAATLFQRREIEERFAVSSGQILANGDLTEAEKASATRELYASLPSNMREDIDARSRMSQLHDQVNALRAAGASESDIRAARVAAVGETMTAELEVLDRRRSAVDN